MSSPGAKRARVDGQAVHVVLADTPKYSEEEVEGEEEHYAGGAVTFE